MSATIKVKDIVKNIVDELLAAIYDYFSSRGTDVMSLHAIEKLLKLSEDERIVWILPSGDEPVKVEKLDKPIRRRKYSYAYVVKVKLVAGRWRRVAYVTDTFAQVLMRMKRLTLRMLAEKEPLLEGASWIEKLSVQNSAATTMAAWMMESGVISRKHVILHREPIDDEELEKIEMSSSYTTIESETRRIYHRPIYSTIIKKTVAGRNVEIMIKLSENIVVYGGQRAERHLTLSIT